MSSAPACRAGAPPGTAGTGRRGAKRTALGSLPPDERAVDVDVVDDRQSGEVGGRIGSLVEQDVDAHDRCPGSDRRERLRRIRRVDAHPRPARQRRVGRLGSVCAPPEEVRRRAVGRNDIETRRAGAAVETAADVEPQFGERHSLDALDLRSGRRAVGRGAVLGELQSLVVLALPVVIVVVLAVFIGQAEALHPACADDLAARRPPAISGRAHVDPWVRLQSMRVALVGGGRLGHGKRQEYGRRQGQRNTRKWLLHSGISFSV